MDSGQSPREKGHVNRLAAETSPYLLQHQHNPVDWYPWGAEAFAAAREGKKPIFLSVGYSTCYWCHVMERESFENEAIAGEMNQRFVCIKVDREERPDVDQLYMMFVQLATHHGGWPMSVFLTPDLKPFYGGTYFPPADMSGRPGFVRILQAVEEAWRNRNEEVSKSADHFADLLHRLAEPPGPEGKMTIDQGFIGQLVERSVSDYDARHGGFGAAPKFPRETLLEMLLVCQRHHGEDRIRRMLIHTLDALESGGIRDHLGGGFHRYSTDAQWLVPHFEIMLYDNAMLAWIYVEAYAQTQEVRYAHVARGILDFVLREMTAPSGAFYTAFDAEVDAQEGLSYLWTAEEFATLLGEEAPLIADIYGVSRGPNFADPHHGNGRAEKNILYLPEPIEKVAGRHNLLIDEVYDRLARARQILYAARLKRKQPLLDTKILTSWNALMIRALAYGGQVLQDQRYTRSAALAAEFLLLHHRMPDGGLFRVSRPTSSGIGGQGEAGAGVTARGQGAEGGPEAEEEAALVGAKARVHAPELAEGAAEGAKVAGFLDDYAFLIQALLGLHDAGADERFKDAAHALAMLMRDKFADAGGGMGGFYFTESGADDLIVRQKTGSDSPLPSGNAVAAMVLLELGEVEASRRVLTAFAPTLERGAEGMSAMLQASIQFIEIQGSIEVKPQMAGAGAEERPATPADLAQSIVDVEAEWPSKETLHILLSIAEGYHLNASDAGGLAGVTLRVDGPDASRVAGIDYPAGKARRFGFSTQPLLVYEGEIRLTVRFGGTAGAAKAEGDMVRLTLTYQPCDDSACLPVTIKHLEVPFDDAG